MGGKRLTSSPDDRMFSIVLSILIVASGNGKNMELTVPRRGINAQTVSSGVNGAFFDTKTKNFASLLYFRGKWYWWYPDKRMKQVGGLVCYEDGKVAAGYFSLTQDNKLQFNGRPFTEKGVIWAVSGGGLYVVDGKLIPTSEVRRREKFSSRVYNHPFYSFIVVFKDGKVGLGVSLGSGSPETVARKLLKEKGIVHFLRLDGGSSTKYWIKRRPPYTIHHGFFFPVKD